MSDDDDAPPASTFEQPHWSQLQLPDNLRTLGNQTSTHQQQSTKGKLPVNQIGQGYLTTRSKAHQFQNPSQASIIYDSQGTMTIGGSPRDLNGDSALSIEDRLRSTSNRGPFQGLSHRRFTTDGQLTNML